MSLALAQEVSADPHIGVNLAARVAENENVLAQTYKLIIESVHEQRAITPAAEWLIDNFHIVKEQLRDIRDHLPPQYYRELPKLASGHLVGHPRVYGIAWAYVAHNESLFDAELLKRFVKSYQKNRPLTIGELWAISITLRIVMIENLRRLSARMIGSQIARKKADNIADELLGISPGGRTSEEILKALSKENFQSGFAVQLIQRLRFQDSKVTPILKWLDEQLAVHGLVADEIVPEEHNTQTIANATVRNIITSMRLMSAFDWHLFFEEVSLVDEIFRKSPLYSQMDFITRDRYRHGLEELSRGSKIPEVNVARAILNKAEAEKRVDLGHYLIAKGRYEFEKEIGFKLKLKRRVLRWYVSHASKVYLTSIFLITMILLYMGLNFFVVTANSLWITLLLTIVAAFPAAEIAIAIVNRLTVDILGPRHLPRLKLSEGVPPHLKTFLVVPTLLIHEEDIVHQVLQLEIHYLSNPDGFIHFALLSDWKDADSEHLASDYAILSLAVKNINALNEKYGPAADGKNRFFIFHRKRKWNASEKKWIGFERKRGKLHEFNRLLRGAKDTSFLLIPEISSDIPQDIRYVITLDADTKIPKGAVTQLVGTLAHPLNHPKFDVLLNRVIEGYGILQPRITPSLPTTKDSTLFQRLSSGPCGTDPYASAVSDVYQDLFGEGSYTGKGIYDVDVFEKALKGRVPLNRLLSHDLFEGNFARCGLVSDVEFFEDFPSHASVALARIHRWTRGDWQLLPWILGRAGRAISIVGRLKMIDNLRRSLTTPMIFCLFIIIFCLPGVEGQALIILNLIALGLAPLMPFFAATVSYQKKISLRQHLRSLCDDLFLGLGRFFLNLIFLPHQSLIFLDAIARALFRLTISKRKLLEWTTAATSKSSANSSLKSFINTTVYLELFMLLLLLPFAKTQGVVFLLLWMTSPFVAWKISLPPSKEKIRPLEAEEIFVLRNTARRIWRFFTTFVTETENFIPPDNFQEDPTAVIAHRSSPTNFGLYLLSIVAARDFGWIGRVEMLERLELTLNSLKKLPRHQGHFFNWYRTTDRYALEPRYISSVDNGNLAGHLLAVIQALEELLKQPSSSLKIAGDSIRLLKESLALSEVADEKRNITVFQAQITTAIDELDKDLGISSDFKALSMQAETLVDLAKTFTEERGEMAKSEVFIWSKLLAEEIASHRRDLSDNADLTQEKIKNLIASCRELFNDMDFNFLYEHSRKLFSIGYKMSDNSLDEGQYDLLASEARLLSFIAIAKGDVSSKHWFRLGRALTSVEKGVALISWSGSMFEYLMPSLVMQTPAGSLLDQTCHLVVKKQILYALTRKVPWGISESAYNERDIHFTYQYSNFGIPGLGLKRGLADDLVVAPYATLLAAMYDPVSAVKNLKRLSLSSAGGVYGFYEAIDFTRERLPEGDGAAVIKTYMAHHQGMSLVAIANVLYDGIFRKRFHQEPMVQATELLLQERPPKNVIVEKPSAWPHEIPHVDEGGETTARRYYSAEQVVPRTHLLSNGHYAVMITAAGSGYSCYRDLSVTRWREDVTCDHYGSYIFLRKIEASNSRIWSAGFMPTTTPPDQYEVIFTEDRVKIFREDREITSILEIFVSPEDNAEMRRLSLTNNGLESCEIEVTSYAEVVLNTQAADIAHPAFSNLFVQTEYVAEISSLLVTRRPRSQNEATLWLSHGITSDANAISGIEYETDRARFIGRGRSITHPVSIFDGKPLSNTVGAVLDPIVSLRTRVRIASGATATVTYSTAIATKKEEILNLADKLHDNSTFERVSNLVWTHAQVILHYLGIESSEANLFQELANKVLYIDSSLRPSSEILKRNHCNVSALWAHGISGDHPIVLVRIDDREGVGIIRQLLRAHEYWGTKRLVVDLVILNDKTISYSQELHESLEAMVRGSAITSGPYLPESRGKAFILRGEILSERELDLLQTSARAILIARQGSLAEQVKRIKVPPLRKRSLTTMLPKYFRTTTPTAFKVPIPTLLFFNGLGGFANEGKEYLIHLKKGQRTPAPWINVIANPDFGFQVSESGAGYTWSMNSRENQITPWFNDPVCDPSGECFYLFDKDSGNLWSPTASPIRIEDAEYITHHGQGYSRFELINHGIYSELTQFVHWTEPVKISKLLLKNYSRQRRNLSLTGYVEWVLGFSRTTTVPYIITELDESSSAVLAYNPWNIEFGTRISFAKFIGGHDTMTCDRSDFIGRNGNLRRPAAIFNSSKTKIGAGLDPCTALQKDIFIKPGQTVTITFLLGQAKTRHEVKSILKSMESPSAVDKALQKVEEAWDELLTTIQVETPDPSMNLMLNRWPLYQTIACRLWARSAFYQAGGAYGFRDQLQDSLALMWAKPEMTREQIIRASARQFVEGDVQHWWHPPLGRGVRTRCSDDRLWLPFVVSHYLNISEDFALLEEQVPFLEGPILKPEQADSYYIPTISQESASLYEHCARAIDCSLSVGIHGLPLIGSGDWNDGMNNVGIGGKGESVWLAWFLHTNLTAFAKIATSRGAREQERAKKWMKHASDL
ncbi:MAG: phosphorylase, partial [Oligoflexia bacterium]|nr:phosphorylase [Oligoflexia bacterium]